MAMEKITKEELLKELGEHILSDEELEKISGGGRITAEQTIACAEICAKDPNPQCESHCLGLDR